MKNTILIVDDTHSYQTLLAAMVRRFGFEAETCGDGAEALPLLAKQHDKYVAVLLDIYMPMIDGISTLGHIRSNWPNLPVVVISGSDDSTDEASTRQFGVFGFIKKPQETETLQAQLEPLLSGLVQKDNSVKG